MKTLTCDLCDFCAKGATFDEWMNNLMPHYMEAHADSMKESMTGTEAEQEVAKEKWMADNKARFDTQPEDAEVTA